MSIEEDLWKRASITKEAFEQITDKLLEICAANNGKATYNDFEKSIRDMGYTIEKAKVIIGLCEAKAMFSDVIESWENPPGEIRSFIRQIDKEDNKLNSK